MKGVGFRIERRSQRVREKRKGAVGRSHRQYASVGSSARTGVGG